MNSPDIDRLEARITELEIKAGFADDLIDELNRTVYRQQQRIDELQQELRALRLQIQNLPTGETRTPGEEVPPHY